MTVILSGRPLDIRKIAEKSQAVLFVWRPGTMGAEAVVLLGVWRRDPIRKTVCEHTMVCGTGACQLLGCKDRTPDGRNESGESHFTEPVYGIPNEPLLIHLDSVSLT